MARAKSTAVSFLVVALGGLVLAQSVCAQEIKWHPSLDAAKQAAAQSGKPIMADVFADWCGWCKKLDETTYKAAAVVKLSEQFEAVKINGEKSDVGEKYGVDGFPTILFLDSEGALLHQVPGYVEAEPFVGEMKTALAKMERVKNLKEIEAQLAQNPDSADLQFQYGHGCFQLGRVEDAKKALDKAVELDPENKAGHLDDCRVDLMILTLFNDEPKAPAQAGEWLKANPKHARMAEVALVTGFSYLAREKPDEAVRLFKMAAEQGGDSSWTQKAKMMIERLKKKQ